MVSLKRGEVSGGELEIRFKPRDAGRCRPRRDVIISRSLQLLCTIKWGRRERSEIELEVCLRGGECESITKLMVRDLSKISL
jgi:hypothetical protein